ncbi:fibronectin type III domain-containing protein [Hyphobacterium sp. HN65]|uniref:Fibronectin type III domain-containing protein n=1 Tax=Hyphobacterium lacteum TaxID=3116575 RepID=A0ABU7LRH4_9PROT|nr:fibronectin type III domain-containing protein [Hyphobacterium sp. HN65]MEE2526506.1 fibronectin type III domain-containing protein [Hyphobacterium sp. HN65]
MKLLTSILSIIILPAGAAFGWQALSTPTSPGASTPGYECADEEDGRFCVCVGLIDCMRMRDSEVCVHRSGPLEGTDDFECDDIFDACSCTWPRENQSRLRHPERFGEADTLDAGRRNEVVNARRGRDPRTRSGNAETAALDGAGNGDDVPSTARFDPVSPITDPIEDALAPVGSEIGDAIGSVEDGLADLLGGSSSDEEERDSIVDHRTGRTPPRRNETVPARRGRLPAPSDVSIGADTPTSFEISWQDNARSEHGVQVERGIPVRERGGVNYNWRRIFNSEERVDSRVRGTGPRSDIDDGLVQGTLYCYRLRAYRSDQTSDYSDIACSTLR